MPHLSTDDAAACARLSHWQTHLPQQLVHTDANDYNVIAAPRRAEVSAVIDFRDLCHSLRVAGGLHQIASWNAGLLISEDLMKALMAGRGAAPTFRD